MKKILYTLLLCIPSAVFAQVGVGTTTPDASAQLDVNSTTKGFLPPRMTQAQMNAIASPADGLIVYCTDCNPRGVWNYDGSQPAWVSLGSNNTPNAVFTSATLNCGGTLSGTYQQGTTLTTANTKVVTITSVTGGKYTASTNTVNGVSFNASGTLFSVGAGTSITLTGTGTPLASGTFTYTVSLAGQTCTFNVTFATAATFNCGTSTQTLTAGGTATTTLTQNTVYAGSFSIPYTSGNGSSYSSVQATAVGSSFGLTLTRTAGTYSAGGGTVQYVLSGTYTGTGGSVSFTTDEGCTVNYGDAIRGSLAAAGCTSCAAYDAAAVNNWVFITPAEYNALATTANLPNVSKTGATDASITATTNSWAGTNYSILNIGGGINPIPASSYVVGLKVRLVPSTTITGATMTLKVQQTTIPSVNTNFSDYGAATPPFTLTTGAGPDYVYLVLKRPTATTSGSGNTFPGMYENSVSGVFVGNVTGIAGTTVSVAPGNTNSINFATGSSSLFQFQTLSTTIKSW